MSILGKVAWFTVSNKVLYWGDTYLITFQEDADDLLILMIALAVDIAHAPTKGEYLRDTFHHRCL